MPDQNHLPAVIGTCSHCGQPLYADAPVHAVPLAHVACQRYRDRRD